MGRHSSYDPVIAEEVCLALSTTPDGIDKLCDNNPHWPCVATIYLWRIQVSEFAEHYAIAKRAQIDRFIDQIIDIADDSSQDVKETIDEHGNVKKSFNFEYMARSRLRIDTRKWLASKLAPKIYGDRVQHDIKVNQHHSFIDAIALSEEPQLLDHDDDDEQK